MKFLVILLLAFGLLIAGCVSLGSNESVSPKPSDSMQKPTSSDTSMVKTNSSAMEKPTSNSSMGKNEPMACKTDSGMTGSAMDKSGLSGYLPFTSEKFNQAKREGKVIFLEFYANWCPTCASQKPALEQAFNELKTSNPNVVGFQVNYKDSETDETEVLLAKDYGISYQHTHVILTSTGQVALKSNEMWSKSQVIDQVKKISN